MSTNENEAILMVAGAEKLSFFTEVSKAKVYNKNVLFRILSREMNDFYKI